MEIAQMSARFQERLGALEGTNEELRQALEAAGASTSQVGGQYQYQYQWGWAWEWEWAWEDRRREMTGSDLGVL